MPDRLLIALVAILMTGLSVALVAGHGPWAGPALVGVSESHGLNGGDVPVVIAWVVGMIACGLLWRRRSD